MRITGPNNAHTSAGASKFPVTPGKSGVVANLLVKSTRSTESRRDPVSATHSVASKWDDAIHTEETVYEFPRPTRVSPSASTVRTPEVSRQDQLVGALAECFNKCLATMPVHRQEFKSRVERSRHRQLLSRISAVCREVTLGLQNNRQFSVDTWQAVASFFEQCARAIGSMERFGPGLACRASCIECARNCRAMIQSATAC